MMTKKQSPVTIGKQDLLEQPHPEPDTPAKAEKAEKAVKSKTNPVFLVGYTPRSGAAWLMDTLSVMENTGVARFDDSTLYFGYGDDLKALTKADIDQWFKAHSFDGGLGVKANWVYLDHLASHIGDDLFEYLMGKFTHHIYLERLDTVAQAVSWYIAERSGKYHSLNEGDPARVPYSQAEIASRQAQIATWDERWSEWYRAHDSRVDLVTYEDMQANLLKVLKAIFQFLEITPAPTKLPSGTTLVKLDSPRAAEYVARFKE